MAPGRMGRRPHPRSPHLKMDLSIRGADNFQVAVHKHLWKLSLHDVGQFSISGSFGPYLWTEFAQLLWQMSCFKITFLPGPFTTHPSNKTFLCYNSPNLKKTHFWPCTTLNLESDSGRFTMSFRRVLLASPFLCLPYWFKDNFQEVMFTAHDSHLSVVIRTEGKARSGLSRESTIPLSQITEHRWGVNTRFRMWMSDCCFGSENNLSHSMIQNTFKWKKP